MMIVVHFTAGWCVGVGGDDVVVKTDFVALEERVVDTVTVDKPLKD